MNLNCNVFQLQRIAPAISGIHFLKVYVNGFSENVSLKEAQKYDYEWEYNYYISSAAEQF